MRSLFIQALLFFVGSASFAATWNIRLEMKSGSLSVAGGGNIDYRVFTASSAFPKASDLLIWETGDIVNLKVVNTLSEPHGFVIENYADFGTILSGDSVEQQLMIATAGVFRYYDPSNSPYYEYLGLNGIVHVKVQGDPIPYFYWEIREHLAVWNSSILGGASPALNTYDPDFFTINGNFNPDINLDPLASVTGTVGNELRIVLVNSGLSIHSIHFHGFHLTINADSKNGFIGRIKDTFPLYPKEHLVLSCVPDKPGEYPVHDHNLIAVTGNAVYPFGMVTRLLIAP